MIKYVNTILEEKDLSNITDEEIRVLKIFIMRFSKGEYKKVLQELKEVLKIKEELNGRKRD